MSIESIETILIVFIVCIQVVIFLKTKRQISVFKNIIPETSLISVSKIYVSLEELKTLQPEVILANTSTLESIERVEGVENLEFAEITVLVDRSERQNKIFSKILYSINTYLLRNKGATSDFNLIKDITERNADAVEEDINITISIPLYLGLMGTMLGIVIGLFSMSDLSQALTSRPGEDPLGQGITVLLGGVKIAMIASFTGLALTTLNSGFFFKGSKSLVEANKNEFYTFIQTELLPVINQSMAATFESFQRNLFTFNGEFTNNLNKLSGIFNTNFEALVLQESVLAKIEKIDVATVAKYNVNVLKELQSSMEEFEKFNTHASNINSSLDNSTTLVARISDVLARTESLQKIADNLDDKLTQSQTLLDFLSKHFEILEDYKQHTNNSISEVGFSISETFSQLKEHIENSSRTVKEFTVEELDLLRKALSESKTDLDQLQHLETINQDVSQFKDSAASQSERIRMLLQDLNNNFEKSIVTLQSIERSSLALRKKGLAEYVKGLFNKGDL